MESLCNKCNGDIHITDKHRLTCSYCKSVYHLECTNVSDKRFYIMDPGKKSAWKCINCIHYMSPDNVTTRKYQINISTDNSFASLSEHDTSDDLPLSSTGLCQSCPDLGPNTSRNIENLSDKLIELQHKLEIAENEIENLLSENFKLKGQLTKSEQTINILKSMCSSTRKNTSRKLINKSLKKVNLDFSKDDSIEENNQSLREPQNLREALPIKDKNEDTIPSFPMNASTSHTTKTQNIQRNHEILTQNVSSKKRTATKSDFNNETKNTRTTETIRSCTSNSLAPTRRIWIFGSQRCRNLAMLINSTRRNTNYEDYKVFASIKPNADTQEILKECYKIPFGKHDKILLSVGENDKNPMKTISEFTAAVKYLTKKNNVIIFDVVNNQYINEKLLNYNLEIICKNTPNCNFIRSNYNSKRNLIDISCDRINFIIDCIDYDDKYLCKKNTKPSLTSTKCIKSLNNIRRGTIPYYFKPMTRTTKVEQKPKHKKTILDYFPIEKKSHNPTRKEPELKYQQFFRE